MCNVFVYSIYCTLLVAYFSIYLIGVMLILVSAPANKNVHSYTLAERYLRFFYRLAMLITANLLCKYVQNFRFKAHKSAKMPRVVQLRSFGENALEKINAWNRMCFCFAGIALLYIITLITSMSCHQIRRTNYCHLALEDIDGKKNLQHRTNRTCSHQHSMAKVRRCMCGRSSWWQSRGALRPETKTGCGDVVWKTAGDTSPFINLIVLHFCIT